MLALCKVPLLLSVIALASARTFPSNFLFGAATSSYQIEGAWNEEGKGPSIWDNFTHADPTRVDDKSNGDVACDSYHKYKEDVGLLADLGMNVYRFSIAWSRILPNGYANDAVNDAGIKYYQNLVAELKSKKISAAVTLYHWDLPQKLLDDGIDWTNPLFIDEFVGFARIVIKSLPDADIWFTINEPKQVCHSGYGTGEFPPGIQSSADLEYQCAYVLLKAHAAVYHMYKDEFPNYKARMAMAPDAEWAVPKSNSKADAAAVERKMQFDTGIYYHPIYAGDWPEIVKTRVAERSKAEGLKQSRLPNFTDEEIHYINGTADFLAFNHYITFLVNDVEEGPTDVTSYDNDLRLIAVVNPSDMVSSNGWEMNPWGIRKMFQWFREQYGEREFLITETGLADNGSSLEDDQRIKFYSEIYCNVLDAIEEDGANVLGLIGWSIMDNFEWLNGYTAHFGLHFVDFTDPERTRTPKKSAGFIKEMIKTREINCTSTSSANGFLIASIHTIWIFLLVQYIRYL